MINIAVCDDELLELEHTNIILTKYSRENPQYELTLHSFTSPLEMLSYIAEHGGFDILLLDIYMAGMLGTEAAKELRLLGDESEIIFLTSSRKHSLCAFELNAAQYLVKPYSEAKLITTVDKIIRRINVDHYSVIALKTSKGITRLAPKNVLFTESSRNNYQLIHMVNGNTLEIRMTASQLFEILSQNKFLIKCGASLNINLKYIRQISKDTITFDTGKRIRFPYRAYKNLKDEFLRFQMT